MKRIAIIEDDEQINHLLKKLLTEHGYEADCFYDGMQAMTLVAKNLSEYGLLLLDLMLPHFGGELLLKKLREASDIPVIVLSAKSDVKKRIDVIRQGADDYVTKPFDLDEVLARIEAVLRRSGQEEGKEEMLCYQNIELNPQTKCVLVEGKKAVLSAKEFDILELLIRNPKKLFSKANIFETVWKEPFFAEGDLIKVHINRIRNKLQEACPGHEYIETVWGMGYRMFKEEKGQTQ